MSRDVYLHVKANAPAPYEMTRITVCERMGWTFAEYDALDVADLHEILAVWDGMEKAKK